MTLQPILKFISALILLYCAFSAFVVLVSLYPAGFYFNLTSATIGLICLMAVSVCFVTSYRQFFRQRPRLVLFSFVLVISIEVALYISIINLSETQIEAMNTFDQSIQDAIREGLENGTIPKGQGFEEQLESADLSLVGHIKSILFHIALFIIPIYTNLRTLPEAISSND